MYFRIDHTLQNTYTTFIEMIYIFKFKSCDIVKLHYNYAINWNLIPTAVDDI